VVLGLGNPGWRYRRTRHNIGFRVVDETARRCGARWRRWLRLGSRIARFEQAGRAVLLVKPQTYVNRSGLAVRAVLAEFDIAIANLFVVVDDVSLPLGRLRVRRGGSDGGHNGLKSIVATLESTEFARLRVGVGASRRGSMTDHVLGRFERSERPLVRRVVATAADAVAMLLAEGVGPAMNTFNAMDLTAGGLSRPVEE